MTAIRRYSIEEEICSSIIHGIGVALGIVALTILTSFASKYGNAWTVVSSSIFGSSMILLYLAFILHLNKNLIE